MKPIQPKTFLAACLLLLAPAVGTATPASAGVDPGVPLVRLNVLDQATGEPMAARIHLKNGAGQPQRPDELPFWHDHFVCNGSAQLALPPGTYRFEVERGPEFGAARGMFSVESGSGTNIVARLGRIAHLAREGWWSGETHVHRGPDQAELIMRAEDLHVAQFITWWNQSNPWAGRDLPGKLPVTFDGDRFYHHLAGEDERDGGALLYFNLEQPLDITGGTRHYPSSLVYAQQARARRGCWTDIEKPFWWDLPMWLAHDIGDSIGIAQNHMQRGGMLDNEAWGKARDRERFPGPHGNGFWTQEIYYHLLNCGLRLPPSAGSASGVLANPVGYNRVYVHIDGELTWEKWWNNLRAGRCFVSNGPLLRVRVDGQLPGHVFKSDRPLTLQVDGRLDSRDPIAALELVSNGQARPIQLPGRIRIEQGGWFLVRALASPTNTFRFASTGPFYVEIGATPRPVQPDSARFFLDWTRERMARLKGGRLEHQAELLEPWVQTERFWLQKLAGDDAP